MERNMFRKSHCACAEKNSLATLEEKAAARPEPQPENSFQFSAVCLCARLSRNDLSMFGGFGGLKDLGAGLGSKAEQLLEQKKQEAEKLAAEKKQAASGLLEEQAKKTGDFLWQTKSDIEKAALGTAVNAKEQAIDAFDQEFSKAEKAVDSTLQQASTAVDTKMKEADSFLDEKRQAVGKAVADTTTKVKETKESATDSLAGKAKGLLNF